jgi:hypothetical protein
MPNDTDFSVAIAHGLAGLNYAFIGRPELYHTPAAAPAAVEPGAVQSLGDQVWAMTQALAFAPRLPAPASDPVWFDLFGRLVLTYPPSLGWLPVGLSGLLLAMAAWRQRPAPGGVVAGAAQSLAGTVLAGLLLTAYGRLFVTGYYQGLGQEPQTEIVTGLIVLASALVAFNVGADPRRPAARWLGAAATGWVIAAALQTFAPLTAFLAAWPVLAAGVALALGGSKADRSLVAAAMAILALGFLMETWHAVILGVGLTAPVLAAALCPLAFCGLAPFLRVRPQTGVGRRAAAMEQAGAPGAYQQP